MVVEGSYHLQHFLLEAIAEVDDSSMADIKGLLACILPFHQLPEVPTPLTTVEIS